MPQKQKEGGVWNYFEEEDSWVYNVKIGEAEGKDKEAEEKICGEVLSKVTQRLDPKVGTTKMKIEII